MNKDITKIKSRWDEIIAKYKNNLPIKPPNGGKPAIDKIVKAKCFPVSLV